MAPAGRGGAAVRWDSTVLPPLAAAARNGQDSEGTCPRSRGPVRAGWRHSGAMLGVLAPGLPTCRPSRGWPQWRRRRSFPVTAAGPPRHLTGVPLHRDSFQLWWSTSGRMLADPERQRWDLAQHASTCRTRPQYVVPAFAGWTEWV